MKEEDLILLVELVAGLMKDWTYTDHRSVHVYTSVCTDMDTNCNYPPSQLKNQNYTTLNAGKFYCLLSLCETMAECTECTMGTMHCTG